MRCQGQTPGKLPAWRQKDEQEADEQMEVIFKKQRKSRGRGVRQARALWSWGAAGGPVLWAGCGDRKVRPCGQPGPLSPGGRPDGSPTHAPGPRPQARRRQSCQNTSWLARLGSCD